jgi:redox-sensitive bicupin YhaK (pirin superfamily)
MNAVAASEPRFDSSLGARRIVFRTRGSTHGAITRLVSPSDVGEMIKPFVFLDFFEVDPAKAPTFGWHPHSGIATVTVLLEGQSRYEETTGVNGVLSAGGVEWMRAAGGVWHTGGAAGTQPMKGFQLWIALPPELENGAPESRYLSVDDVSSDGPARIVLGSYGRASSEIPVPPGINYLDVSLRAGERWTYQPPPGHTVAWIAVHEGLLRTPESVSAREVAVFDETGGAITFEAVSDAGFVLGSAVKHPHDLILGYYSVHTNRTALVKGEAEIERIGAGLIGAGKVR